MNAKTGKMKKIYLALLLWLYGFMAINVVLALHLQASPTGTTRIYGYAWYLKEDGDIGHIRRAKVELWDIGYVETKLAISETNDGGYYEFNIGITGSRDVYAKIYCESYIVFVTQGVYGDTYFCRTPVKTTYEGGTTFLGYYYAPPQDLWWHAMDFVTDEYLWLEREANWVRSRVEIRYPKGDKPLSYGDVIDLPSRNIKNWGRPDVLHEYAHCVMYALYGFLPQGDCSDSCQCPQGNHYFNSVSDSGFAFSEGWANFMQSAVDNKPSNTYIHNLGDVDGNGISNGFATTIEDNRYPVLDYWGTTLYWRKWYHGRCPYKSPCLGCPSFNNNGNIVEGAVAGIFWDIFDPQNDDQLFMGFSAIWYVLSMYRPLSMVEFLDRWPYTGVNRQLCDVSMDHGITVFDDLDYLYFDNTYFVAGDVAYCTDVLGSAKTSFGLAKGGVYENPEGRTERILKETTKNNGNLILIGGPAVSPLADNFDKTFGITYEYQPGVSFRIRYHDKSIYLNLADYPRQDVCIVFVGEDNSRSVMVVWGYGWQGTYAGSAFIGNPVNWNVYRNAHMLMIRWVDTNYDGLVQAGEMWVESSIVVGTTPQESLPELNPPEPPFDEKPFADANLFGSLASLFYSNTYFVAGNQAYCTDVLGSAKIAFGLAKGGVYENPEGRTDTILTSLEHMRGNLITVGGPAINPLSVEFGSKFGITYNYVQGRSFQIFCEGRSIYLDLTQYSYEDICIVYVGRYTSQYTQNIMLVWGYGWQGTYAGSVFIGNPATWQAYSGAHLVMLRWRDLNGDGLVQTGELLVEQVR
jgi:hypothetical protein